LLIGSVGIYETLWDYNKEQNLVRESALSAGLPRIIHLDRINFFTSLMKYKRKELLGLAAGESRETVGERFV